MVSLLLIVLYILTLTAIITAVYGSLQREANHSHYVILLSLVIAFFALGSLIILASSNTENAFTGFRIQHIGQPFLGGLWFLYTMDLCGYSIKSKPLVVLIMTLPIIMFVGVTAGDPLGLLIHSLSCDRSGLLPYVTGKFTPLYNAGLLHIYGFNAAAGTLICIKLFRHSHQSRTRLIFHLCAGLFPFLVGFIAIILDFPYKREAASTTLCVFSVILNVYLLKAGAFRIVSKAKYQLFESVQDGILIVNKRNGYLDANDIAKKIFPVLTEIKRGASISSIEGFSPLFSQSDRQVQKITVTNDNTAKHYTVTRSNLLEENRYIGSTFMLYDITELEELTVKLRELATIDELTQVNNRRSFFSHAEGMIAMMHRFNIFVCVAMLDLDDFKQINDSLGHLFGDEVLRSIAAHCKALLRQSDILGRYGGEEFGIVFYGMDAESAVRRLENLRQSISKMVITHDNNKASVTVSIGFAFVDYRSEKPLMDAIAGADKALYHAKKNGKNQVFGEPPRKYEEFFPEI